MTVKWYGEDVKLLIKEATAAGLYEYAQIVVDRAKINITENSQVDTGFMRNSGYAVGRDGSTYDQIDSSGTYIDDRLYYVEKEAAPERDLPSGDEPVAIAAFAAEYTLYQEVRKPFLYPALEQTAGEVEGVLRAEAKKRGG